MNEYDTVYLGFPVWNGTMPMPVFSFLEEYNFAGKTIIPSSTHEGSGLGRGKRDIESECPEAEVLDGLAVRYTDVLDAEEEVRNWLNDRK